MGLNAPEMVAFYQRGLMLPAVMFADFSDVSTPLTLLRPDYCGALGVVFVGVCVCLCWNASLRLHLSSQTLVLPGLLVCCGCVIVLFLDHS